MPRLRKSALAFDAITLEGSLISPAKLGEVADRKASEQNDAHYHIPKGLTLRDETARYFRIGQALFRELFVGASPSHQATIRFTQELLRDVFGFADIRPVTAPKVKGDRTYILHLESLQGRVPVVVVPPSDDLDHASAHLSHDRRRSAATSLQDWLNSEDSALWGLCCNGERLRLLRDNESLTRPAYIEANLRQLFEAEDFAGFAALWLMLHASRFGRPGTPATDCALERWREAGGKEGLAARERLSVGVKDALLALGNGFVSHAANSGLRDRLTQGQLPLPEFFNELLRLVYRLIFLLAAEDRDLLHPPNAPAEVRKLYADGYSLGALRDRAIRRSGWDQFHDRWEGLLIVFRALAHGEPRLGLSALGGLFDERDTPNLNQARLSNRALMEAIFRLAWLREDSSILPVNWRDMETEELGSVYEGLLELTPRLTQDGRRFAFAEGLETKGNERKKTGSYYTPDSLVQALLDSALDPVLDSVESEAEDAAAGLLGITVIDPACGSGHFLLAAARRIATRVARARTQGVPSAADYRHALRDAVRCSIHGIDRNPMAIELAKVALWIETVEPAKPLGFLDANLRVGDSLLGIFDLKALENGIPDAAYKPLTGDDKATAKEFERRNKADKGQATRMLDFSGGAGRAVALPPLAHAIRAVRELPEDTLEQIEAKIHRFTLAQGDPRIANLHQAADLYIAAFLIPKTQAQSLDLHTAMVPTTEDVWSAMHGGTVYGPRLGEARKIAQQARAFHWPLEFTDIMANGGFDVVLGNPPWDVLQLSEEEYFAQEWPEIASLAGAARKRAIAALEFSHLSIFRSYELEKKRFEAKNEFTRSAGRFELTARGKVNTYSLFAELFQDLASIRGRAGIIVPTGIATDSSTSSFFSETLSKRRLVSLHDFQTGLGFFDDIGHARFKFSLLTLCHAGQGPKSAEFSFFSRTMEDFRRPESRFNLSSDEIALINPNTRTAPIFRSRYDARLVAEIYSRIPVLVEKAGGKWGNRWRTSFRQGLFNMTSDSSLFRTAEELSADGWSCRGSYWILESEPGESSAKSEPSTSAGDETGSLLESYVPLYEAKMIHHFDHRWATFDGAEMRDVTEFEKQDPCFSPVSRYWVPEHEVRNRLADKAWSRSWLLGWRDITNATNERTIIASCFPRSGVGNNLPLMVFEETRPELIAGLLGCLSSLVLDYVARHKVGGTHLNFFIYEQLPILPPDAYNAESLGFITPRVLELVYTSHSMKPYAEDIGYEGVPFTWDQLRRAVLRAELDAWYAHAYGLTHDDLRFVLDPSDLMGEDYPAETFRGLKGNEMARYGEYRTRRLVLEAWDRMERGELPRPEPYDRNRSSREASASQSTRNGQSSRNQNLFEFAEEPAR